MPESEAFSIEAARIRKVYSQRNNGSRYSAADPAHGLAVREREKRLLELLAVRGYSSLARNRILEIGCGTGHWLCQFVAWGARPENVSGIDILAERVEQARHSCPAGMQLMVQNAADMSFPDGGFDLVLQSTVFTSILDAHIRVRVAREMLRVLSPNGMILWYDFCVDNPFNPNVRGVGATEIEQLFPNCRIELEKLTLAPPLGRPLARISQSAYSVLSKMSMLCTHYLGTISRNV